MERVNSYNKGLRGTGRRAAKTPSQKMIASRKRGRKRPRGKRQLGEIQREMKNCAEGKDDLGTLRDCLSRWSTVRYNESVKKGTAEWLETCLSLLAEKSTGRVSRKDRPLNEGCCFLVPRWRVGTLATRSVTGESLKVLGKRVSNARCGAALRPCPANVLAKERKGMRHGESTLEETRKKNKKKQKTVKGSHGNSGITVHEIAFKLELD